MTNLATKMAPMRRMRGLGIQDPFKELFDLQRNLSQFFEANYDQTAREDAPLNAWTPAVDIFEDDNEFVIKLEVPEVNKEDIKVNLNENVLSISGERRFENEEKRDGYHRVERRYGQFFRSFTLPPNVNPEAINAQCKDGVLRLTLPKREEAKPKQIAVKVD